jgi:hypothetical protein
MAFDGIDRDPDSFDLRTALREFLALGLCAGSVFALLILAHGLLS